MVEIGEDDKGVPVSAKIVFVRDKRTQKWLALLSTDTYLNDEQIIMTYKRRWDIEVFFKMAKSFRLPKSARVDPMTLLPPMSLWCAADTSCCLSPRGPTRTPELWGHCFTPVAKNSSRPHSLMHLC
jgi:hypothetical protein